MKLAYSDQVLSGAQVFKWHKAFLNVREIVEDEARSERQCTSKTEENVGKVKTLIRSDRRLTIRMIDSELNLDHRTVHDIWTRNLDTRKICAKMVPKNLVEKQKETCKSVCVRGPP